MRKRVINPTEQNDADHDQQWLNIEKLAVVEVTSEDGSYPIEKALLPGEQGRWRASVAGRQTIRFLFDHPQAIQRIRLEFEELEHERTQEYVLSW